MDNSRRSQLPGLTIQQKSAAGLEASVQGTLAVDESTNCLVLRTAVQPVDVAWPKGWSVANRDGSVVLVNAAGETAAKVGDTVRITGGFITPGAARATPCTESTTVFAAWGEVTRS